MNGLMKVMALLLMVFLLFLFLAGLFSQPNIELSRTVVIDAPVVKVWTVLTDFSGKPFWDEKIQSIEAGSESFLHEGSVLTIRYDSPDNNAFQKIRVSEWEDNKTFAFVPVPPLRLALLEDFRERFHLKRLVDGTTELTASCQYSPVTFAARIYSEVIFKSQMEDELENSAALLKKSSEKI